MQQPPARGGQDQREGAQQLRETTAAIPGAGHRSPSGPRTPATARGACAGTPSPAPPGPSSGPPRRAQRPPPARSHACPGRPSGSPPRCLSCPRPFPSTAPNRLRKKDRTPPPIVACATATGRPLPSSHRRVTSDHLPGPFQSLDPHRSSRYAHRPGTKVPNAEQVPATGGNRRPTGHPGSKVLQACGSNRGRSAGPGQEHLTMTAAPLSARSPKKFAALRCAGSSRGRRRVRWPAGSGGLPGRDDVTRGHLPAESAVARAVCEGLRRRAPEVVEVYGGCISCSHESAGRSWRAPQGRARSRGTRWNSPRAHPWPGLAEPRVRRDRPCRSVPQRTPGHPHAGVRPRPAR
jgi:hypothetical protein